MTNNNDRLSGLRDYFKQKLHDDDRIKHAAKVSNLDQRILHLEAELVRERERNEAREREIRIDELEQLIGTYNDMFEPNGEFKPFGKLTQRDISNLYRRIGARLRELQSAKQEKET